MLSCNAQRFSFRLTHSVENLSHLMSLFNVQRMYCALIQCMVLVVQARNDDSNYVAFMSSLIDWLL